MYRISAFLPAFNEEGALTATVVELRQVLADICEAFEIIVVDDGSTDGTARAADTLARADDRIRLIRHERNRGYGAAVRSGLGEARLDLIFFTDADGQFDVQDLRRLLPHIREADIVAGYRLDRADPAHRILFARVWAWLMRVLLAVPVRDVDCAFKLFRRTAVAGLALTSDGAFISAELLAKAVRRGARVVEVGVRHGPRRSGSQTGGNLTVLLRAFHDLVRLYGGIRRVKSPTPPSG